MYLSQKDIVLLLRGKPDPIQVFKQGLGKLRGKATIKVGNEFHGKRDFLRDGRY